MFSFSLSFHIYGCLNCFLFLAIMNKAAMNMIEQVPLWYNEVSFFAHMAMNDIDGS